MYQELRAISPDATVGTIQESTPESWAQNFAASTKLTAFQTLKMSVDRRYSLIRKYIAPGGRILDAGCGFGEWVTFLKQRGFAGTGLDYSQTLIDRLRQTYPETEWICDSIEKIPASDRSYDGIISWGVIEHDEAGPQKALAEFYRVLKPGGHAVITVPYDDARARRCIEIDAAKEAGQQRKFYCYYMSKEDLSGFMRDAGFEVLDIDPCPPASLGKILPDVYIALSRFPRLQHLVINLFGLLFYWKKDWFYMMYAIGRRPL